MPRAALAASILLISSGCASLEGRLDAASDRQGAADAGVVFAPPPEDCGRTETHAPMRPGDEARSVLKRERAALDRQNDRGLRCYAFALDQARRMSGAGS